jgi:thiol-disulfide isomerase/thioredoxin
MTRANRRRRPNNKKKPPPSFLGLKGTGLYVAGFVVAVVAVAAIAAASLSGGDDEGVEGEFPITVYQGADVLGATQLDFNTLLGQGKPVVLNFWAGACPPCRAEMPAFQRVWDANKDDILLVGVDIGPYVQLGSQQDALNLLAELDITYPAAFSVSRQPVLDYGVQAMPTTVFFDGAGQIVSVSSGLLTEEDLSSQVDLLLSLPQ